MTYVRAVHEPGPRSGSRCGPRRRGAATAFALLLAALLTVAGCSRSADSSTGASGAADRAAPAQAPAATGSAGSRSGFAGSGPASGGKTAGSDRTPAPARDLVRTAELTVRTPHVQGALAKARALVEAAGGYTADEDTSVDSRGHTQSSVQLRVPSPAYDRLLTDLSGLGTLLGRKAGVQDVTGQVVDVNSRVASQRVSVARVRALMERAGQLSDVVSLEAELSTREAALESLEAQQASLRSQTDLATVTLRLTEPPARPLPPKPKRHDGFWAAVGHALGDGWHAFSAAVRGILVGLSVALPFLVVALLGWSGYRLLRRWLPGTAAARSAVRPTLRAPDGTPEPVPAPAGHEEEGKDRAGS